MLKDYQEGLMEREAVNGGQGTQLCDMYNIYNLSVAPLHHLSMGLAMELIL